MGENSAEKQTAVDWVAVLVMGLIERTGPPKPLLEMVIGFQE